MPHIEDYVNALNDARDYKKKYEELRAKYEKVEPQLQKDKALFQALLDNLNYLPREAKEYSGIKKFIVDINNILKR